MTAPLEPKRTTEKQLHRARRMATLSIVLLIVSLTATLVSAVPGWAHWVVFLMWNHVAVIIVFGAGSWTTRRLGAAPAGRVSPSLRELLSPWVLGLALVSAAIAVPNWGPSPWEGVGLASDGSVVNSHQWHSEGGRYFDRINRGPAREISQAEYDRLEQRHFSSFARMWTFFSFASLMIWRFIALRRRDLLKADPPSAATMTRSDVPRAGVDNGPGRGSTALIVGIWVALIGSNVLSLTLGPHRVFCAMPMPPEMEPFLLVMPLLVIGGGAFWTKRSPFMTPWLASLIDQRLGVGGTDAFMAQLKPMLLVSVTAFIGSATLLGICGLGESSPANWTSPGFLASTGVALALAHVILRRRGIPGV